MKNRTIADSFKESLERAKQYPEFAYSNLTQSPNECVRESIGCNRMESPDIKELADFSFMVTTVQYLNSCVWPTTYNPIGLCQSPIEISMLLALGITGRTCGYVNFVGAHSPGFSGGYELFSIEPQAAIGRYRADFRVSIRTQFGEASVLVECDGHDFHDRTKEQASKDRRRDRDLQRIGYKVLRFTGSDIWRDVFACAKEVIDALREEVNK